MQSAYQFLFNFYVFPFLGQVFGYQGHSFALVSVFVTLLLSAGVRYVKLLVRLTHILAVQTSTCIVNAVPSWFENVGEDRKDSDARL